MCTPSWETHILNYMFSPTLETHIIPDMCSPTLETHIPTDMCASTWDTGKYIPLVICDPLPRKHISRLQVQQFKCLESLFLICSISLWCGLISGNHRKRFRINPSINALLSCIIFPHRIRNKCQTKAVAMVTTLFGPDTSLVSAHPVCPQMG